MKKTLLLAMFALMLTAFGHTQAQDCRHMVLPCVGYNQDVLDNMPEAKIEEICRFSRSAFFLTNEVPDGAPVHDIAEVKANRSQQFLPANYVVDLDSLGYYWYNFNDFQHQHNHQTVYFRIGNSDNHFLGLYSYDETMARATTMSTHTTR